MFRRADEWMRFPWDVEDAFGADHREGVELCDPKKCSANSTAYCILSCEKFNSPLFCDKDHPQDVFSFANVSGVVLSDVAHLSLVAFLSVCWTKLTMS